MGNIRFINDWARAHWAAKYGASKDLVLVVSEAWPEGAVLTQEGAAIARKSLTSPGAQYVLIDPAMAALAGYEQILDAEDVRDRLKGG